MLEWRRKYLSGGPAAALRRDEDGSTAIEFGLVGLPFLMMLFGIIAVGLFFFTTFALENAVEDAARLIRTGQAQQSGMTAEQFKQEVCARAPQYVDCDTKMRVNVQSFTGFGSIVTPTCIDAGGDLVPPAGTTYNPGGETTVVLVTVCYEWELAGRIPFLNLSNMSNGSALIQASTTFRTEPYNN
jgi:Flp pilus assembly protein TadG